MTPIEFLRAHWPATGIYCLAIPRGNGYWRNWTFDTIEAAAAQAVALSAKSDIYFAMHTLRAKQVPRIDGPGEPQTRVQRNTLEAKCFFWDIDVGDDPKKYPDQATGLSALIEFTNTTRLPKPTIVSSGRGLHIYWRLTDTIPSEQWRDTALHLRQLAAFYGLKIDTSRTIDTASVLRVAGTFNHKDPLKPLPVQVLMPGKEHANGVLLKAISDAVITAGINPQAAPKYQAPTTGNLDVEYDGPVPAAKAVFLACRQMANLLKLKGNFSEKAWYLGAIGVGRFTQGGDRTAHKLSAGYKGYSVADTDAKIAQSRAKQRGPSSCQTLADAVGDETACIGCPHLGQVHGPIQAAYRTDPAAPPVITETVGTEIIEITLPDAPAPYVRLKNNGGIAVTVKNADDTEVTSVIYDHDLYPVKRITNAVLGIERQVWRVVLPRGEMRDFTIDADALYDLRKFIVAIANQGIYPDKGQLPYLMGYMVAYIKALQKHAAAEAQSNHLGWTSEEDGFILPDKILMCDGSVRPAQLSVGAHNSSSGMTKRGTLEAQVKFMEFYNNPVYTSKQFHILASLAAPIFGFTGHHGIILNASGHSGAAKSTTLGVGAASWGEPEAFCLNGTNNGATVRGRNERMTVLANLPILVDEITHIPLQEMRDLALSVSQSQPRVRLNTDGTERASVGGIKATIMVCTANTSMHALLSTDNAAGTAGAMRVFEIMFVKTTVHTKQEADVFWRGIKANHGHIGPAFMDYIVRNREKVRARVHKVMAELEVEMDADQSERFWSAIMAAILVAGEIANHLRLLSFDMVEMRRWLLEEQVPFMRGVVKQEYSDPLSILSNFFQAHHGNILRMRKGGGNLGGLIYAPLNNALLMHYDIDDGMMYVLKKAFKDYCTKSGANSSQVINALHEMVDGSRPVPQPHTRRVLGAGTEHAKAQSWCFAVNMLHPAVSGAVNLELVQGGQDAVNPTASSASLQSVK